MVLSDIIPCSADPHTYGYMGNYCEYHLAEKFSEDPICSLGDENRVEGSWMGSSMMRRSSIMNLEVQENA
jgi:hypothetical protein